MAGRQPRSCDLNDFYEFNAFNEFTNFLILELTIQLVDMNRK